MPNQEEILLNLWWWNIDWFLENVKRKLPLARAKNITKRKSLMIGFVLLSKNISNNAGVLYIKKLKTIKNFTLFHLKTQVKTSKFPGYSAHRNLQIFWKISVEPLRARRGVSCVGKYGNLSQNLASTFSNFRIRNRVDNTKFIIFDGSTAPHFFTSKNSLSECTESTSGSKTFNGWHLPW